MPSLREWEPKARRKVSEPCGGRSPCGMQEAVRTPSSEPGHVQGGRPWWTVLLVPVAYLVLAAGLTWPLAARLGELVPGASRSDLWNSLWSMWFVADSLGAGRLPWETALLNHPDGGVLMVADPLGALVGLPLVPLVGLEAAYGLLVMVRLAAAGLCAHAAAVWWRRELGGSATAGEWLGPGPWLAGVALTGAPMLLAGVHNGTSESTAWAPMVLACWACLAAQRRPSLRRVGVAAAALALATLASGYSAVIAFVIASLLSVVPPPRPVLWRMGPVALGLVLALPLAALQHCGATHPDNLVGIKNARELALVRRTTGAADPWTFVLGGDFRSPDFAEISRYGEAFIHTAYVGHVVFLTALVVVLRRRVPPWILVAGLGLALLALGPVWVQDGAAVIFWDERVLPLPYLLLERLPGLGSLSLVWRLGAGLVLAVALTAGAGLPSSTRIQRRLGWALVLAALLETTLLSPLRGGPALTDARIHPLVVALREAPPGAVVNFPVAGGRAYLHEQTAHGHPLAATLNFPNNTTGQRFWRKALAELDRVVADGDPVEVLQSARAQERFARGVAKAARALQVRYLVIHSDPDARPDMHDAAVRAIEASFPAWSPAGGPATPSPAAAAGPHARPVSVIALY